MGTRIVSLGEPESSVPAPGRSTSGLTLGELLGEGGTARVLDGHQHSLDRRVAVKLPRSEAMRELLLREACITGALEHPNILPIHDIQLGPDGSPCIVMKKVVGETWGVRMSGMGLDANLRVLHQVCNAVAFAHANGIIHRDLKPENVMIGAYGEVTVVDWGLAVGSRPGPSWLPLAADWNEPAGTPVYMAPEQVGDPDALRARGLQLAALPPVGPVTERTDVFLLGAILYEILMGRPPYGSDRIGTTMALAWACAPASVTGPAPLVRLVNAAMVREPARRAPNVAAFREGIEDWSTTILIEAAVQRRDIEDARRRLGELRQPVPELSVAVEQLARSVAEERRLLARMDQSRYRQIRYIGSVLLGVGWTIAPLMLWGFGKIYGETAIWAASVLYATVLVAALGGLALSLRGRIGQSQMNRFAVMCVIIGLFAQMWLDVGFRLMGLGAEPMMVSHLLLWAVVAGLGAVGMRRRLGVVALVLVVAFIVAAAWPSAVALITALANGFYTVGVFLSWRLTEREYAATARREH